MSWFTDAFGSGGPPPPVYSPLQEQSYYDEVRRVNPAFYETIKHNDPAYLREQQGLTQQAATTGTQQAITQSQATNPVTYSGPGAPEELAALLPPGFESSYIPSGYGQSNVESLLGKGRSGAQAFIDAMLKRGTLTRAGGQTAGAALGTQEAGARTRLEQLRDALLESGRANLRGIASEGATAAAGQSGEFFDPTPYQGRVQQATSQFQEAFPTSYTASVGDVGSLFDTAALAGAGGGVTSPQNISFDPYAAEGGKLSTGLEEEGGKPPAKKRTTAVF